MSRKEPRRQVKIYLQCVFLPPPSTVLASIHSILACDVPRKEDVGLPTNFRFIVGPASQPIAGSMLVNHLQRWPNTNPSLGLMYTLVSTSANTWHSPNNVSMLTHSLRRWPDIETPLGDCTMFSNCCIPSKHETITKCCFNAGPASKTVVQDWNSIGWMLCVCWVVMLVTLSILAPETPDNTIHWPNVDVMLGHRLRRWANIIPNKTF